MIRLPFFDIFQIIIILIESLNSIHVFWPGLEAKLSLFLLLFSIHSRIFITFSIKWLNIVFFFDEWACIFVVEKKLKWIGAILCFCEQQKKKMSKEKWNHRHVCIYMLLVRAADVHQIIDSEHDFRFTHCRIRFWMMGVFCCCCWVLIFRSSYCWKLQICI